MESVNSLPEAWANCFELMGPLTTEQYNEREEVYMLGASAAAGLLAIQISAVAEKTQKLTAGDIARIIEQMLKDARTQIIENNRRRGTT